DPLTQCCTTLPNSGTDFTLCPAGTYPLDGVCVDDPTAVVDVEIQDVIFDKCSVPVTVTPKIPDDDDDPGGSCTLTDEVCKRQNQVLCSANCSCQSPTAPCP
ncbi:MAG: hypothetical protein KJZ72_20190, partial [Anaerolineales bacterium]|nr:hypothetical protein [Anaerolineales bacterium]